MVTSAEFKVLKIQARGGEAGGSRRAARRGEEHERGKEGIVEERQRKKMEQQAYFHSLLKNVRKHNRATVSAANRI